MKFLEAIKMEKNRKELEELNNKKELEDINFQEKGTGKTALHYAIESEDKQVIDFLLKQQSCKFDISDNTGRSPLTYAVANNKTEIVEHLLKNKEFFNKAVNLSDDKKQTVLNIAIMMGNLEMVKLLIENGVDPNQSTKDDFTPLMNAVRYKKKEIVEFLLKIPKVHKGINESRNYTNALFLSYPNGDPEIFSLLVKSKNIDVDVSQADETTPLMYAVSQRQKESVKLILTKSLPLSSINKKSDDGNSALFLACFGAKEIDPEIISLLLEHGADPFIKNKAKGAFIDLLDANSDLKSEAEKKKIAEILLKCSIKTMNAKAIFKLKEKPIYKEVYESLSSKEKEKLAKIMTIKEEDVDFFTKRILEFTSGFGNITLSGGLLTVIQVNQRKKTGEDPYIFNPTIFKPREFDQYLECIKNSKKIPLRERFIIASSHWRCGEIFIDKNNEVHVLFIDSMGKDTSKDFSKNVKKKFPAANIYLDKTERQKSAAGCSVYALDDVRHLYTIEKYLEPKYKETGLFGYLSANKRGKIKVTNEIFIDDVPLPIPFMRTTQSSVLYKDKDKSTEEKKEKEEAIISSRSTEEQSQPLGKNKGTAKELQASLMKEGFKRKSGYSTEINERLREKLESMCEYNFDCLLHTIHSQEEFSKNAREFTLEGFKERMSLSVSVSPPETQTVSASMEQGTAEGLHFSYLSPGSTLTPEKIFVSLINDLKKETSNENMEKDKVEELVLKIKKLQEQNKFDINQLIPGSTETFKDMITSLPSTLLIQERVLAFFQKKSLENR